MFCWSNLQVATCPSSKLFAEWSKLHPSWLKLGDTMLLRTSMLSKLSEMIGLQVIRQSMQELLQAIEGRQAQAAAPAEPFQGTDDVVTAPEESAPPPGNSVIQLELRQAHGGMLEMSPSFGEVQVCGLWQTSLSCHFTFDWPDAPPLLCIPP